jgi:hypothetical protein
MDFSSHFLSFQLGEPSGIHMIRSTVNQPKVAITDAQRRARILLAAWNSGDLSRLRQALQQSREDASWCFGAGVHRVMLQSSEQEREELLEAATETVRTWLKERELRGEESNNAAPQASQSGGEAELQASLRLLNHLATAPLYSRSSLN